MASSKLGTALLITVPLLLTILVAYCLLRKPATLRRQTGKADELPFHVTTAPRSTYLPLSEGKSIVRWPWVRFQDLRPENVAIEGQKHRGRRGAISGASRREPVRELRRVDVAGNMAALSSGRGAVVDLQGKLTGHSRKDSIQHTSSVMRSLSPVTETTPLPIVEGTGRNVANTQKDRSTSRRSRGGSHATRTRHNSLIPVTVHDIQDLRRKINFQIHVAYSNSVRNRRHRTDKSARGFRKVGRRTAGKNPRGRPATTMKSKSLAPQKHDDTSSTINARGHTWIKSLHPIELPTFPPSPRFSDLPYARTDSTPLPLNALQRIATVESSLMDYSAEEEGRRGWIGSVVGMESAAQRRGGLGLGFPRRQSRSGKDERTSTPSHSWGALPMSKGYTKDFVILTPPPRGRSIAIFGSSQRRASTFSTFPSLLPSSKVDQGYLTTERRPKEPKSRSFRLVPLPPSSPTPLPLALSQPLPPSPPEEAHLSNEESGQRKGPREERKEMQACHQTHPVAGPPILAPRLSIDFSLEQEKHEEEENKKRQWKEYRKMRRMEIEMEGLDLAKKNNS